MEKIFEKTLQKTNSYLYSINKKLEFYEEDKLLEKYENF